jgi:hypothetical protein
MTAAIVLIAVALPGVTGCGGNDTGGTASGTSSAPRSADYQLPQQADVGLRQAFVTFTERDSATTTGVIEIDVERTDQNNGLTYPVGIYAGSCDALGKVERDLGAQPPGVNTVTIDAPLDEVVGNVQQSKASIVIMKPDRSAVAWCGPASKPPPLQPSTNSG